jgi:hypothetical protein
LNSNETTGRVKTLTIGLIFVSQIRPDMRRSVPISKPWFVTPPRGGLKPAALHDEVPSLREGTSNGVSDLNSPFTFHSFALVVNGDGRSNQR